MPALNLEPTQVALDRLDGASVEVLPMRRRVATPHLKLIGDNIPEPRPAASPVPNAIAATPIVWAADRYALLRDPDGHFHHLTTAEG